MLQDFRYAIRLLSNSPGFTTIAVLSLALGIGANTAIFTLLNAVLLRSLPVHNPQELVLLGAGRSVGIMGGFPQKQPELFSYPFYTDLRSKNQVFTDLLAIYSLDNRVHVSVGEQIEPSVQSYQARLVSGNYFSTLGVPAFLGRTLTDDDNRKPGAHPVAVVSYDFWKKRLGQDRSVIGKVLHVSGTAYTIVGVTAPEFFGTTIGESTDIWFPLMMQAQVPPGFPGLEDKLMQGLYLIGRLKPGVRLEQAAANVNVIYHQHWNGIAGPKPDAAERKAIDTARIQVTGARRGLSQLRRQFSTALELLMAVVALVLLIACANVANLVLARATARKRELAIRLAIGAGRGRLVSQLIMESVTLALAGGVCGILLAAWASQLLLKLVAAGSNPVPLNVEPDARVLLFTLAVSVLTGLLFGLVPAWRAGRVHLNQFLTEGKGMGSGHARNAFGRLLVAGQVALSLLLIAGATLFIRSLANLQHVNTGFNRDQVVLFDLDMDSSGYKEDQKLVALSQRLEERVRSVPGVTGVSLSMLFFNKGAWVQPATPQGLAPTPENSKDAHMNAVTGGFFETVGIPKLLGRSFGPQDNAVSQKVAVLNETAAKDLFPDQPAVGRRFRLLDRQPGPEIEVVGVVKDAKYEDLRETPVRMVYFPLAQQVHYPGNLEVRLAGNTSRIIPAIRRAITQTERNIPIGSVHTLGEIVDQSLARERLISTLCGLFGALALTLACIGLYGVLAYAVQRRTNEIGIRMALGSDRSKVLWLVLREAVVLLAIGFAIGIPAALAVNRLLIGMLYGLSPMDPVSIVPAALLLIVIAGIAAAVPAYRATRVDPLVALRYE